MAKRILVIGSANIDFIVKTPYVPERGETLVAEGGYSLMPGGKGANTAVAVSRLGAQAVFCSRVGDDAYGERLKKIYAENGIDLRFVRTDKIGQTGLAVVLVEKDGANRIIVYPGANLLGLPEPTRVLYLDMPVEATEQMMRLREEATHTKADIHEKDEAYLRRCRENAAYVVARCGWTRIDCAKDGAPRLINDIHREVMACVADLIG